MVRQTPPGSRAHSSFHGAADCGGPDRPSLPPTEATLSAPWFVTHVVRQIARASLSIGCPERQAARHGLFEILLRGRDVHREAKNGDEGEAGQVR